MQKIIKPIVSAKLKNVILIAESHTIPLNFRRKKNANNERKTGEKNMLRNLAGLLCQDKNRN